MSTINLGTTSAGERVEIDIPTLVSTRLLVTASSGGGKSETLRRILEEASQSIQCIVIDPEGEFSTLREKRPFVLVGEGGETVADIRTAALVATRLLELNVSAVCDLYEMRVQDRHQWVRRFLDSMVHAPKALWHPVLVVIDEAHTFAPEKGCGESVATQSVIDIANLGRKRGFCVIPATQRLSKLSKNVVEPMQNYLVGRTTFDDQARAASVFKIAPGAATRAFSMELEKLNAGQFIARGRAITGDMLKVQVTLGMTRPPATGTSMAGVVTPTPEAIKAFLPKLADLPHEAEREAKTVDELQGEVTSLKRQLAAKPANDPAQIAAAREEINQLQSECNRLTALIRFSESVIGKIKSAAAEVDDTEAFVAFVNAENPHRLSIPIDTSVPTPTVRETPKPVQVTAKARVSTVGAPMGKAERSILTVLAQRGSSAKTTIAAYAGYAVNGGGFNSSISKCRTNGWITGSDPLTITDEGIEALGSYEPLPTGDALVLHWEGKLGKAEREILGALVSLGEMDKEKLASHTGYAASGGGFNNAISRLRTLELVEGKGRLMLTPDFRDAVRA